jgi:hypothetical protein
MKAELLHMQVTLVMAHPVDPSADVAGASCPTCVSTAIHAAIVEKEASLPRRKVVH